MDIFEKTGVSAMTGKNTVLIVDDAQINRITLKKILNDDYEVMEAEDGQQALDILDKSHNQISAVVLDLIMPEFSGFDFMKVYQKSQMYRSIPVVIATSEGDAKTERECLELGAWDFISKPYDPSIIRFRIKNVIERSQHHLSKELKYRAEYDTLTGIYNKIKFFQMTKEMLDRNPEQNYVFIRLDIEKFQLINSFFGMTEGDKLLRYMAGEIRKIAEENPGITFGRIEADIFGICMPYHDTTEVIDFVERTRGLFERYKLEFDIVPTFGIYIIEDKSLSINDMYDRANLAVKQCKGNYIQNYAFYTDEMSREIVKEQKIVNGMKKALELEEFILYIQPKYELQSNTISGGEVLVRWANPKRGMVSPGEFIPIFERNGFIMKLDFYVWEKTCQLLQKWMKDGKKVYPVSVNISRVSLYNPKLVEVICGLVQKYEIPPELLQLELTESAYTSNPDAIKEMMERFQREGFSILMDDFGSGYSSLNVLKDIAVDILKIDMKFLSDTDRQGRSENILASVVRMAKWLNMPVVAEGVEREEQVAFLKSIGCEYVQGFYFAKPMPVEEYEKVAFGQPFQLQDIILQDELNADNLWNSTSQMEILFSNMLDAVAIYEYEDGNFDVIRVNNAYYNLFGYDDINNTSRNLIETVNEEYRDVLLAAFSRVVSTREMTECEFMRRLDSSKEIWVNLKLKYINAVGKKHVIFGSLTDMTTQKELDRELQKYRAALSTADSNSGTILVVDDIEANRETLKCIFENNYRVLEAENGQDALKILKETDYKVDIILLDLMMPVMDGTAFLEYKRGDLDIAGIPVIIITSDDTTKRQVQTLELGADDYIVKPFIPEIAIRRVTNVLESNRRFGQMLRGYNDALEKLQRDELTGLYNRNAAGKLIQNVMESKPDTMQAMLMVDINNIREIADRYSHKIAEDIICVFADSLKNCFRKSDILARYERDEFIIFIVDAPSVEILEKRCERLLRELRRMNEGGIELECSIGAAISDKENRDVMELMEKSDKALYEAKQKGKNKYAIYQES